MMDNTVSSTDGSWAGQSASSICSDFKAAVGSSGENQWSGSHTADCSENSSSCEQTSCEQPKHQSSCDLNTTGFSAPAKSECGLSTTGFSTNAKECGSLSVGSFHTNASICGSLSVTNFQVTLPSCGCEDDVSTSSCEDTSSASSCSTSLLTESGDSVSDGTYTITGSSSDDGSLTVTDNCTGQVVTEIWGDPHVNDGTGAQVGEFTDNNVNITLPDGTRVLMEPTAVSGGVAHIENATITSGDDAVTMNGVNGTFQDGVTLSTVFPGASAQNAIYANGATELTMTQNGSLYVNNANGTAGQQVVADNGVSMDLDGLGGAASSASA